MWVDIIQSIPGLKSKRNSQFSCLTVELGHLIHFIFSCPQIGIYIISSPSSQAITLRLNCTPGFPGSPGCKQHIMGLFSLHNCASQSLIFNLLLYRIRFVFFWGTSTNNTFPLLDNFETHFIRSPEGLTRLDMSLVAVANTITYISFLPYPISQPPLLDSLPKSSTYTQGSDSGSALRRTQLNTARTS